MRRINSVGSKNSFELSPIYTGHFRKPSRASAEPLTIEGMNAFVLRLMMRMLRGSLGIDDGSLADIGDRFRDVRFAPESGHDQLQDGCLLCANSRHTTAAGRPRGVLVR